MKTIQLIIIGMLLAVHAIGQDGKTIFNQNCASCHLIGKGRMVGPDLKDVHLKYDEEKLFRWIRSSQTVIEEGDPDAISLFKEYQEVVMPDQPLSDNELKLVVGYIKDMSEDKVVEKDELTTVSSAKSPTQNRIVSKSTSNEGSISNEFDMNSIYIYFIIFGGIMIILIVVLGYTIMTLSAELSKQYKLNRK